MDDKTWATIAIQLGVINPGLAEEFQRTKAELGLSKSLPQALKENGLINDTDLEAVSALEPVHVNGTPQNDYQREQQAYAHKCLGAALINEEQATECLRDLVIEGQQRALRDLLLERHYATSDQLEALSKSSVPPAAQEPTGEVIDLLPFLEEAPAPKPAAPKPAATTKAPADSEFEAIEIDVDLTLDVDSPPPPAPHAAAPAVSKAAPKPAPAAAPVPASAAPTAPIGSKKKMKCVKCRLTLEVITRSKAPNCPKCKIPLEDIGFSPQLKTDATYTTTRFKAIDKPKPPPPLTTVKPKYTCTVCDANFDAVQEPGGRLHCPSCGASFTPR
jgi:DNA-directed RNA polymerase subunit RPC12/RpoP